MLQSNTDTIVAQATPVGSAGIGVVRISGPNTLPLAKSLLRLNPEPRYAHYGSFYTSQGETLDFGISLFFKGPSSFTGEDVLELQGHGGQVVIDLLIKEAIRLGARIARPGEFSERAFLNDKLDLMQAEAIADLIACGSEQAARSALLTLKGVFSDQIHKLVEELIRLRVQVEAAIDFPEEEIDFIKEQGISKQVSELITTLEKLKQSGQQGRALREGCTVVIVGAPNAGKSSLMNAILQQDSAIVTDIPGTTRDVLREHILIDGVPIHLIDTAGLRETSDPVEVIGVQRARKEIEYAEKIILVVDATTATTYDAKELWSTVSNTSISPEKLIIVYNKIDLCNSSLEQNKKSFSDDQAFYISTKTGIGLNELKAFLTKMVGITNSTEGVFLARGRHLEAINNALDLLQKGKRQLDMSSAGELLAEDLRSAQEQLNKLTGDFTNDDLLGEIFSSFCIGK